MKISIAPAQPEDVPGLVSIQKQAFARLYQLYGDETSPYLRGEEEFALWFSRGHHPYKIYADGEIAGGVTVFYRGEGDYYLARIFVLPELQGKGIGRQAIRLCEKNYPQAKRWLLDYPADQLRNRCCYEACGYVDTGRRRVINDKLTLVDAEKPVKGIFPLYAAQLPCALSVIHASFATVAASFGLTRENCPTHTSFLPLSRLKAQKEEGWLMFGLFQAGVMVGFSSLSHQGDGVWELHHLAVVPEARHKGYGKALLDHAKEELLRREGKALTLSIIEESQILRDWYISHGFRHTGTKVFSHLPFTVGFLRWDPPENPPQKIRPD